MPKGNPNPQTIASERYQKKNGYISKSYKLKNDVVNNFKVACENAGVSQAEQLSRMMKEFFENQNHQEKESSGTKSF